MLIITTGMEQNPYERRFGFLLHDIARLMRKRFDARTRDSGLTRAQWQVLAVLRAQEGVNQATLAEALDLEPITVGRLDRPDGRSGLGRTPPRRG